ncbi:MAG: HpcH/HpaI aldolase/citrate lyase family protein [Gammaproteobacteria bacterium]|nr:HpcH/HpaI aldolase/citrate lyase family protein [Gammaproteobacteria bacterium]MCP5196084.1 HpcH/HpaI aldolase/citrate lyase family protein [Gammaproteobacteria bacterium]
MSVIPVDFCASHTHFYLESAPTLSATQLGASLYVPASRPDLAMIAHGQKAFPVRSLIFCTEDALHERELEPALNRLAALLPELKTGWSLRFIRPRNPSVLRRLLRMNGIEHIQGFVLPKIGPRALGNWLRAWDDRYGHWLMPVLETPETFDRRQMETLRDRLEDSGLRERILCLRIGGNDLLNLLGIRRARNATIYDTPLRGVISDLVCIFHPAGYSLSAPVFERLDMPEVLAREVDADLQHGLVGKTAIHPMQIPIIEKHYQVSQEDYEMAAAVLEPNAAAVFKLNGTFCEPATHQRWAAGILERAKTFGMAT